MEVKPGYKQTEVGVIPEEWEVKPLRGINFDISDGNYSSKYPKASDFRHFGVPFIRANNVQGMTVVDDDMRFISLAQHQELLKGHLKANDILITTRGEIGQLALVPQHHVDSNINAQLVRINTNNTGVDHRYLVYAILSGSAQEQLKNLQTGSALKQLPVGRLVQLQLTFPPPPEQRAIATALSDVDGLLGGLDRLIAKKRDLKQAAMQQLLTGQTRLPGFHDEWQVRRLGEHIVRLKKTTRPSSSGRPEGAYPFFTNTTKPVDRFLDEADFDTEAIIGNTGGVAYFNYYNGCFAAMADCFVFETKLVTRFLYYLLKFVERTVNDNGFTGSGIKHLDKTYFYQLEVSCPATLPEQAAIASVLTEMDGDLAMLEQRREKTRALKQAMMQELLTGRTRLL